MSSDNLLKGFGVGADVAGQLATAVALRRKNTTASARASGDVVEGLNGQVIDLQETVGNLQGEFINVTLTGVSPEDVPHNLGRVPAGAIVVQSTTLDAIAVTDVSDTDVELSYDGAPTIVLWVL